MKKTLHPQQYEEAVDYINLKPIKEQEDFIECLNTDCKLTGFAFLKSKALTTAECYGCMTPYCVKCRKIHEGKRHICYKPPIHEDPFINQLIQQGGARQCPVCYQVIQKTEEEQECWFIYCPSERCQERTCFCFICGDQLDTQEEKHFKHFPKYRQEYICLTKLEP